MRKLPSLGPDKSWERENQSLYGNDSCDVLWRLISVQFELTPKQTSSGTKPSEKPVLYDPAGGQSLPEFYAANPGKHLVVPPEVSLKAFAQSLKESKGVTKVSLPPAPKPQPASPKLLRKGFR